MWRNKDRYNTERIGERADPWPTPTLMSNDEEEKLFQKYLVLLLMR